MTAQNKHTYNRVVLQGNVGSDPRIKYLEPEVCSAQFSVATNTAGAIDAKGHPVTGDVTDWHSILCYRELAQLAELQVRSGTLVRVEGRLTYREWRTNRGERRKSAVVLADTIEIIAQPKHQEAQQPTPEKETAPYGEYLETVAKDANNLPF